MIGGMVNELNYDRYVKPEEENMAEEDPVITFETAEEGMLYFDAGKPVVVYKKKDNDMRIYYYYQPNWYERLHWWLAGFRREEQDNA